MPPRSLDAVPTPVAPLPVEGSVTSMHHAPATSQPATASAAANAPAAAVAWQSEEARGYNELLDSFSLHQFIIRRGKTLSDTPEYESFKRKYLNSWGGVTGIIRSLEKMLEEFTVPVAYIDGNRVVTLARDLIGPPSNDELLSCIVNIEQVLIVHVERFMHISRYEFMHDAGSAFSEITRSSLQRQQFEEQCCASNTVCL